jgi:bacterial/archaeal transporter family-2 protein
MFRQAARGLAAAGVREDLHAWAGGFLVAYSVTVEVANRMRQGVGPLLAVIVAGNLASAMAIDHFGLLGMRRDAINWYKVGGAALLVAGAALMQIRSE